MIPAILAMAACGSLPAEAPAQVRPGESVAGDDDTPRIHVDATAIVKRAPDRAVISLAVESTAPTADEASGRNAEIMAEVLEALRGLGIDDRDIQTRRLDLSPRYDTSRDRAEPRITGYVARNQVSVATNDVEQVGAIVDAGVGAGANRVSGINFELQDPESAHHEALQEAVRRARREAEVAVGAVGGTLGPVLEMRTSAYYPVTVRSDMAESAMMRADAAAPTPVQPGELDIQATVSITFRIGT